MQFLGCDGKTVDIVVATGFHLEEVGKTPDGSFSLMPVFTFDNGKTKALPVVRGDHEWFSGSGEER